MKQVAGKKVTSPIGRGSDTVHASNHIADGAGSYLVHPVTELVEVSIAEVVDSEIDSSGPVDDFIYLDIGSVDRERKTFVEPKLIPLEKAPSRARQKVQAGDVLVSMTRPNLNAVAQVTQEFHGSIASTGFHVLRSPWIETGFLYYLVQTDSFVDAMCSVVQGALYPAVRPRDIEAFKFCLPPRTEQTRIVEKLEELLSDLDAGVAELTAAQRKLAQYRQSLLKAAVKGALTADWRAARASSDEPPETGADLLQRILTERRARWEAGQLAKFAERGKTPPKGWKEKYVEPLKPSSSGELSIPSVWAWTGVEQLADGTRHALKAGPFGSALKKEFYTSTGYKIYGQEQVIRNDAYFGDYFVSQEKYEELISCAIKPGDLLISLVGTIGKILVLPPNAMPGIINPRLLKVSLSPGNIIPAYVQIVLESPYARHFFKMNAHGGTMDVLNLGILKELAIPIPELAEQEEIVQRLDHEFETIEYQASAIEYSLKQSAAQRKNILKAAFAGQLVPQDPDDEPASVLLERIRTERAVPGVSGKKRGRTLRTSA